MPPPPVTPELLAVARGEAPADLLLTGARIINVFAGEVLPGCIAIHAGRIASVSPQPPAAAPKRALDVRGAYIAPGFIDAHMHVESTMLPPSEFARLAIPHGTTGVVLDPHEIANVLGVPGIRALMDNAGPADMQAMRFLFALSSCVPSCHLETAGAKIEAADLAPLFDDPRVVALAEMMNFPGLIHADPNVLAKVNLGLQRRIVDGHAPGLSGPGLQAYAAAGISSDHECFTIGEAREKLRLGFQIYIREGSAARNLEALLPLVTPANHTRFCFCTDDRHPGDLRVEGHIDHIVRNAIRLGLDPVIAITIGSINTARHYRQPGIGAVAPGCSADFFLFDDLQNPTPRDVYFKGALVARDGAYLPERSQTPQAAAAKFPSSAVRLPPGLSESSFRIPAKSPSQRIRVIGMDPHQLITTERIEKGRVEGGVYVSDPARDILKLAVIERHKGAGNIGLGFIHGFALQRGAIASTVGHDSHNLAVVGASDADMLAAARVLSECAGGQCAVLDGQVLALLPLPIAGLMSNQPADKVIEYQRALLDATHALGCPHHDPFMPLSFMPLPVIPKLKLSDLGLVDVEKFELVPVEV
jgi:adenine deaminase